MNDLSPYRKYLDRINYFCLMAVVITLPYALYLPLNSFCVILFLSSWLLTGRISFSNKLMFLYASLFFIYFLGWLLSNNKSEGAFEIQKKLSLLIFPIVLAIIPALSQKQIRTLLVSFLLSCSIITLGCVAYALFQYFSNHNAAHFSNQSLSGIIGMHANYLAMYIAFSIFILAFFNKELLLLLGNSLAGKIGLIAWIFYLLLFLFLLSARIEILAFCTISILTILVRSYRKGKIINAIGLIMLLLTICSCFIYFNKENRERFKEAINYKSQYGIEKQWGGRAERILIWDCCLDIIKANPLAGVGIGNSQNELQKCYQSKNYGPLLYWPNAQYNAHNQYFQTAIDLGMIGLLVLLINFIVSFYIAIKHRNLLFISFIFIFAFSCFTESMLERQNGIIFYSLFNSLFVFHFKEKEENTLPSP